MQDDVDPATKLRRLQEAIAHYKKVLTVRNEAEVSRRHMVLVEGSSRRDDATLTGKTCTGKRVFLPAGSVPPSLKCSSGEEQQVTIQAGIIWLSPLLPAQQRASQQEQTARRQLLSLLRSTAAQSQWPLDYARAVEG